MLAGGSSSRFGSPKTRVPFGDSTLLERATSSFSDVLLQDAEDTQGGPVFAIATALERVHVDVVQIVAVDVPFAAQVLSWCELGDSDAAVPVDSQGQPQWLCAKYRVDPLRQALRVLDSPIGASMRALAALLQVEFVELGDAAKYVIDVDTPEDLEFALQLLDEPIAGPFDHR